MTGYFSPWALQPSFLAGFPRASSGPQPPLPPVRFWRFCCRRGCVGRRFPLFMRTDAATLRPYWRKWNGPPTKGMIIGAAPRALMAAWVHHAVDADMFRSTIGAIGGFASFIVQAGGPPAAVFLSGQGLSKLIYQATTVITFWAISWLKIRAQSSLLLAPFALLGAWIGAHAHRLAPVRAFFMLTYVLLLATGARLVAGNRRTADLGRSGLGAAVGRGQGLGQILIVIASRNQTGRPARAGHSDRPTACFI